MSSYVWAEFGIEQNSGQSVDASKTSLQGALAVIREQLHADLVKLRSGAAGSHEVLRDILANVTQQVDAMTSYLQKEYEMCALTRSFSGRLQEISLVMVDLSKQVGNLEHAVKKEHEWRTAVEAKVGKIHREQESKTLGLCSDMKALVHELSTFKVELAEQSKDNARIEIQAGEANEATEAQVNKFRSEEQSTDWSDADVRKLQLEESIAATLELAENSSDKIASGIVSAGTGEASEVLKDELLGSDLPMTDASEAPAKCSGDKFIDLMDALHLANDQDFHNSLKVLRRVTQQVQSLEQSASTDHDLLIAMEAKVDKMFSKHDKMILDLRRDVQKWDIPECNDEINRVQHARPASTGLAEKIRRCGKERPGVSAERKQEKKQEIRPVREEKKRELLHNLFADAHLNPKERQHAEKKQEPIHTVLGGLVVQSKTPSFAKGDLDVPSTPNARTKRLVTPRAHTPPVKESPPKYQVGYI